MKWNLHTLIIQCHDGAVISNDPNFEVFPTETTFYTARVTYTTCTGNPIIVEDEININRNI